MEQTELQRRVKGIWIPIEIWEDENLSWNEKILLLEIDSFSNEDKPCFISDEYIAKLLGVHPVNANKILNSLIKKGYVKKISFDGRKRLICSMLRYTIEECYTKADLAKTLRQTYQKHQGRLSENAKADLAKTLTYYNNITNNKLLIKKEILSKDNIPKERELSLPADVPEEDKDILSTPSAEETLSPNPLSHSKAIDWGAIKMAWNNIVTSLPQLSQITERRKKAIKLRAQEQGWSPEETPDRLADFFRKIQTSDFLTGKKNKWFATFDWVFLPSNFIKILEGNYDNNKQYSEPNMWSGAQGVALRYQPNPEAVEREREEERREKEEYDKLEDREYSVWEL